MTHRCRGGILAGAALAVLLLLCPAAVQVKLTANTLLVMGGSMNPNGVTPGCSRNWAATRSIRCPPSAR